VAITAGIWSKKLLADLGVKVPLDSERGYHVMFKDPGVTVNNSLMDADRKFVASSMEDGLRAAGTVDFGGVDSTPLPNRAQAIAKAVREMLPDLPAEPTSWWSGQRPSFPDTLPAIGPVPGHPGLFAGFGHAHWGFMMAPKTGRLLAGLIANKPANADMSPFRLDRFA
jgi:D-amino-acid dehydrogenase